MSVSPPPHGHTPARARARMLLPARVASKLADHQPQDCEIARPHRAGPAARPRRRGDRIRAVLLRLPTALLARRGSTSAGDCPMPAARPTLRARAGMMV